MAKTQDMAAEKARKQKIFLAVAGVLLIGVAAFQLPKILGGDDSTPAAAPAVTTDATTGVVTDAGTVPTTGTTQPATPAASGKPATYVAGVGIRAVQSPSKGQSQLATFTLFEAKDPFVQQVDPSAGTTDTTTTPAAPAGGASQPPAKSGGATTAPEPTAPATGGTTPPSSGGSGGTGGAPAPQPTLAFATVLYNGNPMQVEVKKPFPEGDPTFVLPAMKKNAVKVGVAGGSLAKGGLATLGLGKKLTLVNIATGERFVLKLLYVGSSPEQIATFSTGATTDEK